MHIAEWIALVSVIGAACGFVLVLVWRTGHYSARIEALENWRDKVGEDVPARLSALEHWRGNVRIDMHEISEKLEAIMVKLESLTTLVSERTGGRRETDRLPRPICVEALPRKE